MDPQREVFAERFSEWLRHSRREYGSRTKLAQALSVTETSVSNWEHGTVPDGWAMVRILVELRPVLEANPALRKWGQEVLFGIETDDGWWECLAS